MRQFCAPEAEGCTFAAFYLLSPAQSDVPSPYDVNYPVSAPLQSHAGAGRGVMNEVFKADKSIPVFGCAVAVMIDQKRRIMTDGFSGIIAQLGGQ